MNKGERKNIFVAILAGGKGERLWPKSRASHPKQNLALFGKRTFMERTLRRARNISRENIFIVTSKENFESSLKGLKKYKPKRIIVEPFGRNTAPATALATLLASRENKDSILIVMPSDAIIDNEKEFFNVIARGIKVAKSKDALVTLGIEPTSLETGYGYIGIAKKISRSNRGKSYKVTEFIEKPNSKVAKRLIKSKKYFWNSGIFIFKTFVMLEALKKNTPILYKDLVSLPNIKSKRFFERALTKLYKKLKNESLDYAIMEKSRDIHVIPSGFKWTDLGSFNAIARLAKKDSNGNVILGKCVSIDTKGSLIFSDSKSLVGAIGVEDVIIVSTKDAVLVCNRRRTDDIKKLLGKIKKKKELVKFL